MNGTAPSSRVDSFRRSLVMLKMPRALEILDATLPRIEQGQIDGIEALDELLDEELSLRENRRVKADLRIACLAVVKTLAGYDFSFQPPLDKTASSHSPASTLSNAPRSGICWGRPIPAKAIATALAVEAVRAGKAVYFIPLSDLIAQLAKAEREGTFREKIRFLARCRCSSSTRSDTCRSHRAAPIYSSSSSTPATKRAPYEAAAQPQEICGLARNTHRAVVREIWHKSI